MNKLNLGNEKYYNPDEIRNIKEKYIKEYQDLEKTRRILCNQDTNIDYIKNATIKFKNEYLNNCYYFYYCIVNSFNNEKLIDLGKVLKTSPAKIRQKAKSYFKEEASDVEQKAYTNYEKRIINQELNFDRNCTKFCINCSYDMKKIKIAAKNLDLTPEEIIARVNDYKSKYKEEVKLMIKNNKNRNQTSSNNNQDNLTVIFTNQKTEEIIEQLYINKVNANDLSAFINDYFNNNDATEEVKEKLNYIYSEYRIYSIVMKRKEDYKPLKLEQSIPEIKNNTSQEFIKEKINYTSPKKTIRKTTASDNIDNLAKVISHFIDMGIEQEKGYRNFELLDYYQLTTLSFDEFLDLYKNVNQREKQILKKFFSENSTPIKIDEKTILKKRDSYFIDGKEQKPTEFEKMEVISYLKTKEIPVEQKIYNQTMTRLLKGTLYKDTKEEKVKQLIKSSKK